MLYLIFVTIPPSSLVTHGLLSSSLGLGFYTHPATPLAGLRWDPLIGRALPGGSLTFGPQLPHQFAYMRLRLGFPDATWREIMGPRLPLSLSRGVWGPSPYYCANAGWLLCSIYGIWLGPLHTHETEGPWPLRLKHSRGWKRRSRSKFACFTLRLRDQQSTCMQDGCKADTGC